MSRDICYECYRPQTSCMCKHITPFDTKTQFIILMHPKEYRKTKNGTGHFTNKNLKNSKIFIGIDFSNHHEINKIINNKNNECFLLYPDKSSINLSKSKVETNKNIVIFILDSTWPCSRKMLRLSTNLQSLQKLSFDNNISSNFLIKKQPMQNYLSTIESTLQILKLLKEHNQENICEKNLEQFIKPFFKMVEYQLECAKEFKTVRYK